WLLRMARNELYNLNRGEGRLRRRQVAAARERIEATPNTQPHVALGELAIWINRLSDDHREVLLLRHVAGLTFDQIAIALDEPRTTGASRYQSALLALRKLMTAGDVHSAAPPLPITLPFVDRPATPPPARGGTRHA
ncbi:MAG: RNA polymerase sigma factor, partial [Phycisphaerales bacterium]|nr:RNA polymerase sigma factor [Phycisphaerales bacterium]